MSLKTKFLYSGAFMATSTENQNTKIENPNKPFSSNSKTPIIYSNNNNNNTGKNRYVVSFGVLILLLTLYIITAAAFQRHSNQSILEQEILTPKELKEKEERRQTLILEKLLEHKDICSELEIFVKQIKLQKLDNNDDEDTNKNCIEKSETELELENEKGNDFKDGTKKKSISNRKNINGKKSLKNGHQNGKRFNKSIKTAKKFNKKYLENKKDEIKKKTSTAEPIIYLFALVLIYLLFKAASDINQHYKTQAKGDKRLRRCSLQSYAQAHKQDRRASKDHQPLNILKRKNQHQLLEHRTQSLDRFTKSYAKKPNEKFEYLINLRKHISVEEPMQMEILNLKTSHENQISNQIEWKNVNTTTLTENNISKNRRCSVPALLTTQRSHIGSNPGMLLTNRRTSVVHGGTSYASNIGNLGQSFDGTDSLQISETSKRRVRMINRH